MSSIIHIEHGNWRVKEYSALCDITIFHAGSIVIEMRYGNERSRPEWHVVTSTCQQGDLTKMCKHVLALGPSVDGLIKILAHHISLQPKD